MEVTEILNELLKFKSITPNDDGALNYVDMLMDGFEAKFIEKEGVKNLLLTKRFGDGIHLCFAGHIDVVPPGDGWESDPFEPEQKGEFIYARGAQDMKSGVAAFLCACKDCSEFNGTLSMLLTSDEEGDGIYGTREVLEYMHQNAILPDFAVVAEPTCAKEFADTIKIGRRGSINGKVVIKGVQGHVAYPQKCVNPVHQLASIFSEFAGYELDSGSKYFSGSKIIITDIRGGMEVVNVTPSEVKIMFNVRNSDLTNYDDVKNYCEHIFNGLDYELNLKQNSKPFLTDVNSQIVQAMKKSVEKICSISPEFNTSGGTSDARFFAAYGVPVVEFGVLNDRIHAANERVKISEVEKLYEIFTDLILNLK